MIGAEKLVPAVHWYAQEALDVFAVVAELGLEDLDGDGRRARVLHVGALVDFGKVAATDLAHDLEAVVDQRALGAADVFTDGAGHVVGYVRSRRRS